MIYTLSANGKVFYVGKTSNPPRRLSSHISKYGANVRMKIRERGLNNERASLLEKEWISKLASRNRLKNIQFVNPPKNKIMLVRLNDEEDGLLEKAAAGLGITVAAFIRSASVRESEKILGIAPVKKAARPKKRTQQ